MTWLDRLLGGKVRPVKPASIVTTISDVREEGIAEPFHERRYRIFAILSAPDGDPPWVKHTWMKVCSTIDPLVRLSRGHPNVRTTQLRPGPGSPNQRGIGFGRIGWGEKGANKWTHCEDGQLVSGEMAEFVSGEVWAPSWSVCHRERRPPDLFLDFANQGVIGSAPQFRSVCILAVAVDMVEEAQARMCAEDLANVLGAVLRAQCTRPWGIPHSLGGYTNAINDMATVGLFRPGPTQSAPPSLSMFAGKWEAY